MGQQQNMAPNQGGNMQPQTPVLVAQLQRTMPMTQQPNQQQQQQNFNQGPF